MDFSLTEEQELLLASIRELITSNFPLRQLNALTVGIGQILRG
ncbi:hypothetical protein SM253_17945, partial [Salmonella enterica]|nr:hypothetical protein [Salmonella enterica]